MNCSLNGWIVTIFLVLALAGSAMAQKANEGRILFSGNDGTSWDIWSIRPDGTELKKVTSGRGNERSAAVSPNGRELVYIDDRRTLQLMDMASGKSRALPLPKAIYGQPAWHPNGNAIIYVVFEVVPHDRSEIWLLPRNGAGNWQQPRRLAAYPPMRLFPRILPDGSAFIFCAFHRNERNEVVEELGLQQLDGKGGRMLTNDGLDSFAPALDPTGKMVAYSSNRGGDYNIWSLSLLTGKKEQITKSVSWDAEPSWSPDGDGLVFISSREDGRQLWLKRTLADKAVQLTHLKGGAMEPVWVK